MQYAEIFKPRIFEIAKTLPDKFPEVFLALEEYDKTRKLMRWSTKTRVNFTVDRNVIDLLRKHCGQNSIKMSALIENLIISELKKKPS